jgi:CDP-diglyceride synthetase
MRSGTRWSMHPLLIAKLTILLSIANGSPVLLKRLCCGRRSQPIDGGLVLYDGRRLFGPSKTIRGGLVSVAATSAAAPLLGIGAAIGALLGGMAIVGDLFSSFLKRRLDFAPSSQAIGLDQIPEALFPLLACRSLLPLSGLDILIGVAVFTIAAILTSPVFYRLGLRDQPF